MRPVHEVTAEQENFRLQPIPGVAHCQEIVRDPVEPEPVGTIILMAFRVTGYDQDCDGSLMARLVHIDRKGRGTGWEPNCIGLYPDTDLVVSKAEWAAMFGDQ